MVSIHRVSKEGMAAAQDRVAAEEPMELQLLYFNEGIQRRKSISVTMRTPGSDDTLAAGFLFTEGILKSNNQVYRIDAAPGNENIMVVSLTAEAVPVLNSMERNFYTTSACGICGKASIDAITTVLPFKQDKHDDFTVDATTLYGLPQKLLAQQEAFESTGGLHASALFSQEGSFLRLKEDVGRHNALDKLIGAAFLDGHLPIDACILLLSGRASFELVQKAAMAGIRVIAAIGAPSGLAVSMAQESGITLIGFLRGERFNIYTHPARITSMK